MKKIYVLLFAAAALLASCTKNAEEDATLSVSTSLIEISSAEYNGSFDITSNSDWAATSSASWLVITPESGHGNGTVAVYVEPNKSFETREATVTVSVSGCEPFVIKVRQSEAHAVVMDALNYTAKENGDTVKIHLRANIDFTTKVLNDWISDITVRSLKDYTVTLAVAKNPDYSKRLGKVVFSSILGTDTVYISQNEQRAVVIDNKEQTIGSAGGALDIAIKTNTDFQVTTPNSWIKRVMSRALVDSVVMFDIQANPAVEPRVGKIIFTTTLGRDTVTLTQDGNMNADINIPDAKFKAYLVGLYDADRNGNISCAEALNIKSIKLWHVTSYKYYATGVTDLTGIEYMTNLDSLDCESTLVSKVDLTKNVNLVWADFANTKLTDINVTGLTKLRTLNISATGVTALDLSTNTALTDVQVGGSRLTELATDKLENLKTLNCAYSKITKLDVSANYALEALYCGGNAMTDLNITGLTGLKRISCENNSLTSLDASLASNLVLLNCDRNSLSSLKVAGLSKLTNLSCGLNSQLTSLSLAGLTSLNFLHCANTGLTTLDVSPCPALWVLHVNNAKLSSINLAGNTALRGLRIDNNSLTGTLDVSNNTKLHYLYADANPSLTTIKVWSSLNVDTVENFYKDNTASYEGGKHNAVVTIDKNHSIDLTADGYTANCYMVSAPGTYRFKATVMGNGATTDGITPATIAPTKAALLWTMGTIDEQNKLVNKVIIGDTVALVDGYIYFAVPSPMVAGNAVIAAYNSSNAVVWSWHIWVSDYDADATSVKVSNGFTFMDRNIGALNDGSEDVDYGHEPYLAQTQGMMYQWGRKDPFTPLSVIPGANATPANIYYAKDPTKAVQHPAPAAGTFATAAAAEAYTVANPDTYVCSTSNAATAYNWFTGSTGRTDWRSMWGNASDAATGGAKTIYDPCPKGWRVPPYGAYSFAAAVDQSKINYFGANIYANGSAGESLYFIVTGLRFYHSGVVQVGAYGSTVYHMSGYQVNSCNPTVEGMQTFFLNTTGTDKQGYYHKDISTIGINANYYWCAQPVRCVKDESVPEPATINLSANGNANCYIASEAGTYSFDTKKVDGTALSGTSATWLWTTDSRLLSGIQYASGKITFKTTGVKGNAVIALLDASNKIVWSWHIWATMAPKDQKWNANTWLDRNVGALSAESGADSYGMLYQWGRKDPFPGSNIPGNSGVAHDEKLFGVNTVATIINTTVTGTGNGWNAIGGQSTADNAVNYPMCFYYYEYPATAENPATAYGGATKCPGTYGASNATAADWCVGAAKDRWYNTGVTASGKTNNDPCPVGYMVPSAAEMQADFYGTDGTTYFPSSSAEVSTHTGQTNGRYYTYSGGKVWLAATGFRGSGAASDGAALHYIGNSGFYWTSTDGSLAGSTVSAASTISIASGGEVGRSSSGLWKTYGFAMRCMKIK